MEQKKASKRKEFQNQVRLYIKVRVQKTKEVSLPLEEDNSGDKAIVKSGTKKKTSTSDV